MKTITLILITLVSIYSYGQDEEKQPDYKNEFAGGININTNGGILGGAFLRYSYRYEEKSYSTFLLEVVNIKHNKEERFSSPITGNSFINGKINYLISIRPQYVYERLLFSKYERNGVELRGIVGGGPSIGLEKPYFIRLQTGLGVNDVEVVPYDPAVHSPSSISGSASFFNGFDQIDVILGLNARLGLNLEYGRYTGTVNGLEIGWQVEAFSRSIPLFPVESRSQVFNSLYLNIYFGTRY